MWTTSWSRRRTSVVPGVSRRTSTASGSTPRSFDDDGRHWLLTLEWDPREGYEHPAPSSSRSSTPTARNCAAQPPASTVAAPTGDASRPSPLQVERVLLSDGGRGRHGIRPRRDTGAIREIAGPYQPAPVNPFLTSNPAPHFGRNDRDYLRPRLYNPRADLQKAGHGCLVDTPTGEWYVAHLRSPLEPNQRSRLGRETAIQKVEWTDDGWLRLTTGGTLARLADAGPDRQSRFRPADRPRAYPRRLRRARDRPSVLALRRPWSEDWASLSRRGAL